MKEPELTLPGLPSWRAHAVYAWKREGAYLYVGVTARGYRRPFYSHSVIDRVERVQVGDSFEFWFFPDADAALDYESELISSLRPVFNQAIPYRRQMFMSPPVRPTRKCLSCKKYIPKEYPYWLCGNCERLKILRTANRLVREACSRWEDATDPKWHQSWDAMYGCEKRKCVACKTEFLQEVWWQAFCSPECEDSPQLVQTESIDLMQTVEWIKT